MLNKRFLNVFGFFLIFSLSFPNFAQSAVVSDEIQSAIEQIDRVNKSRWYSIRYSVFKTHGVSDRQSVPQYLLLVGSSKKDIQFDENVLPSIVITAGTRTWTAFFSGLVGDGIYGAITTGVTTGSALAFTYFTGSGAAGLIPLAAGSLYGLVLGMDAFFNGLLSLDFSRSILTPSGYTSAWSKDASIAEKVEKRALVASGSVAIQVKSATYPLVKSHIKDLGFDLIIEN